MSCKKIGLLFSWSRSLWRFKTLLNLISRHSEKVCWVAIIDNQTSATKWTYTNSSPLTCSITGQGLAFTWWGCCGYVLDINQLSLPTPFYSVLVSVSVFMFVALSSVFHCINSPNNSLLSHSFSSSLISALLVLSTIYLFMKVSLIPDIILCVWLGVKYQLTNSPGTQWERDI